MRSRLLKGMLFLESITVKVEIIVGLNDSELGIQTLKTDEKLAFLGILDSTWNKASFLSEIFL